MEQNSFGTFVDEVVAMDYTELVKALRDDNACLSIKTAHEAADAIEELQGQIYEWYYKYTNYDFDIWDNEEQGPVCYWMPLPEPPKEE